MRYVVSATEARVHLGELMRQAVKSGEPIVVERAGQAQVVILSVTEYERLIATGGRDDWQELVSRARAAVREDLAGRDLPPPEVILRQMREERDEQLLAMR